MTQQIQEPATDNQAFLDEQLDEIFQAAGQAGVNLKEDVYKAIEDRYPSIDHLEIYDAVQRAKRRLKLARFAPDPIRYGRIRFRLPSAPGTHPRPRKRR